jgi:hypothetical protein
VAAGMALTATAQSFYNLDFELARGIPISPPPPGSWSSVSFTQAFPGWTGYCGTNQQTTVLYDYEWLDSAGISIFDSKDTIEPVAGVTHGRYCACLHSGVVLGTMNDYVDTSIAQTGWIPASATSILFNFCNSSSWGYADVSVTFNGISIPLSVVSGGGTGPSVLSGDVSRFANQVGELRFTAPNESTPSQPVARSIFLLDYIRFPGTPAPPDAPTIVAPPQNLSNGVGTAVDLIVSAVGRPPLAYQWFFEGTNAISTGTSRDLCLANVQLSQAGSYSVVITNTLGAVTSSPAMLSVTGSPPVIVTPPSSQTAWFGQAVDFTVGTVGPPPLSYQWFFNGTNTVGSATTTSLLLLANVQPDQAGTYTVVVSNAFGAVTSAPALLSVIPPVERRWVPGVGLTGQVGMPLKLEYANAVDPGPNWLPLAAVPLASATQFYFDLSVPLPPQRFFRARQTSAPSVFPALALHMVPAITLTGGIGSSVRLDYINRFGPIDAWGTLAIVALTNTSQLYFDTSTIGQPPRLYRLVPMP